MKRIDATVFTFFVLCACGTEDEMAPTPSDSESPTCSTERPGLDPLLWKRTHAMTHDLMNALELSDSELCFELGAEPCSEFHRSALGSSDPIRNTIYIPPERPSVLTPLVVDRVVLSACGNRVALDAASSDPTVFVHIDLAEDAPDRDSEEVASQIQALYRRFHGREATTEEVSTVATLADQPGLSAATFSTLACFSIGSTTEFLLF